MNENTRFMEGRLHVVVPVAIGLIAFIFVAGTRILQPTNLAWLATGDPATHYLGWSFFRHAEWAFPIGLNPEYGLELGNSIVFSDSNPLLAFLFKPLSPWLPEPFQYFGIWILACFMLQAWFSWKLIGLFSSDLAIRALGCAILVLSPPMIWRLHGHLSLAGHFLVVAALYLALDPKVGRRKAAWGALLAISTLVHAYLLAMVATIWASGLAGKVLARRLPRSDAAIEVAMAFLIVGVCGWQAGYFGVGGAVSTAGFGHYRMNLLSIVDPSGWSYALPDLPETGGDYEGFNYLGLGLILVLVAGLPAILFGRVSILRQIKSFPVLAFSLSCLTLFAISNNVGLGTYSVHVPAPDAFLKAANVFRASGRMFWPVFYCIAFASIYFIVRGYGRRTAVTILGIGLVLQAVDTSPGWAGLRARFMADPQPAWSTPLVDPFWNEAAERFAKVRWLPPQNHSPHWQTFAAYASTHGLSTDAVYLARMDAAALAGAQIAASGKIRTGEYDDDTLYVLEKGLVFEVLSRIDAERDVLARVDGFVILAPGWRRCDDCPPVDGEIPEDDEVVFLAHELPSHVGDIVDGARRARHGTDASGYLNYGPYTSLLNGRYEVTAVYSSSAPAGEDVALLDVFDATGQVVSASLELPGTSGIMAEVVLDFETENPLPHLFEFRTLWHGHADVTLREFRLRRKDGPAHP